MVYFENPTRQIIVTAVGPDNIGLADPIVRYATQSKANICEIQMFNRDSQSMFAMMMRADWPTDTLTLEQTRADLKKIAEEKKLSIRCWPLISTKKVPRIALCCTKYPDTASSILEAINHHKLNAEVSVMISNRPYCEELAQKYDVKFINIGDSKGKPDNERFLQILDEHEIDYVVLARYMRILPEDVCWSYAGGRIINLHHGLLPPYPGATPYSDAYAHNMLTYGATAHFIIPELDAGNQIIHQTSFSVEPSTPKQEIIDYGQTQNEPKCLVEALQKVVTGTVALHFNKVVRISNRFEV